MPGDVTVVVPFDDGGDLDRAASWDWLARRWASLHPGWDVVIGGEGWVPISRLPRRASTRLWSKARAINRAVAQVTSPVLIVVDADLVLSVNVLEAAVRWAPERGWVHPHGLVYRLDKIRSGTVRQGPVDVDPAHHHGRVASPPSHGRPGGGIVVCTRDAFDTVGGFDERFVGWGGEDVSFGWALGTLVGPGLELRAPLWHLWHSPQAREAGPERRAGLELQARYRAANGDRDAMLALIAEPALGE